MWIVSRCDFDSVQDERQLRGIFDPHDSLATWPTWLKIHLDLTIVEAEHDTVGHRLFG